MIYLALQFLGLPDFLLGTSLVFSDVLPVHESEDQFSGGISAETIPLLPTTHIRCKAIEDLSEYLLPLQTASSRTILDLATRVWGSATAIEVLEHDLRACSHLFEAYSPHDTCLHWLEVGGCSHDFDELQALFICVSSLEQALVP